MFGRAVRLKNLVSHRDFVKLQSVAFAKNL